MKTTVMAFGRMSPISSGHAKLVDRVKSVAAEHGADHKIILSKTQDSKKNPLSVEDKVKFAKKLFPKTNIEGATTEKPTLMHHAKAISDSGTKHLIMVAGSDRVDEYKNLLHKYNGSDKNHNFEKISVVSSGERDPDSEGSEGISGTKLREYAAKGDYPKFKSGMAAGDDSVHREMYHAVRKGMQLESFVQFLKNRTK